MDKISFRLPTLADAAHTALDLQPDDMREVVDGSGMHPVLAIARSVVAIYTVVFDTPDGKIVAMAGIDDTGCIWMLSTNEVRNHPIAFMRALKRWLNSLPHKLHYNIADIRNVAHLKLLKHLGYKFLRVIPTGPNNLYFVEFVKIKNHAI